MNPWCVIWFLVATVVPLQTPAAEADTNPGEATQSSDALAEPKALLAQEKWDEAASAFLRFLRKNPQSPFAAEATFWTGFCQVKSQNFEQAIQTLRPFEDAKADAKWADDALLQLGYAYQGASEVDLALECWKRLVQKFPASVWRHDTLLNIVNLLYRGEKFGECYPYCEQVMKEITDPNATSETRYIGAFCLNALSRFEDGERWVERWFDPTRSIHEAYRIVLAAQRNLLQGNGDAATEAIGSIVRDFPDLETGEWIDALVRASFMLRCNDRREEARTVLLGSLPRLGGQPEHVIQGLIEEMDAVLGDERLEKWLELMSDAAGNETYPPVFCAVLQDRLVADLRKSNRSQEAVEWLKRTLAGQRAEFARYRTAILLSEVLAGDLNQRDAAASVLDELQKTLERRDFKHDVQARLHEFRGAGTAM
jgi:tetratricopeptide (TPR) repeat protein